MTSEDSLAAFIQVSLDIILANYQLLDHSYTVTILAQLQALFVFLAEHIDFYTLLLYSQLMERPQQLVYRTVQPFTLNFPMLCLH